MIPAKIAFVDIETSGMSLSYDRIIEVAVIRIEDNKLVDTFHTLVNPGSFIPKEIVSMTGITQEELENAPSFGQIKSDLKQILQDCHFAAHNVRFDYGFIRNEFRKEDYSFSSKHFCTAKLSRFLYPQFRNHNLDSLISRHSLNCVNRHRALDDAWVLWAFFELIQKEFSPEKLEAAFKSVLKKTSLPLRIDSKVVDSLPELPGVYIFYGAKGMPLYVGKSVNLKERILSHFSNDHLSSTEMKISQQIESIETIVTAGELGALLKESQTIKELQPLYNRKLRHARKLIILKRSNKYDPYQTVEFEERDYIEPDETEDIISVFKSKRDVENFLRYLSKEHNLCDRLLGLEKTKGACFGYRLGACKGACIGKEEPVRYNLRLTEAISKNKLKPWPFESAILIEEANDFTGEKESHLFDKWCYFGSLKDESKPEIGNSKFDLDTYKILQRYLKDIKRLRKIKKVKQSELVNLKS